MSSPPSPPFHYRGHDILDLLQEARNYNRWLTDQVAAAAPAGAQAIVDLGAGRGTFSDLLRQRGLRVQCVEPDLANQRVLAERDLDVVDSIERFAPDSLDYVFTLNVLEHVPEDAALVQQVFTRLRPGGVLFIFVPAFPMLWSRLDDYVEHQRRYRRSRLVPMLREIGFVVDKARYADSLGFFAALLFGRTATAEITPASIRAYDRVLFPLSRALDPVLGGFFGKNVAVTCHKPHRPD